MIYFDCKMNMHIPFFLVDVLIVVGVYFRLNLPTNHGKKPSIPVDFLPRPRRKQRSPLSWNSWKGTVKRKSVAELPTHLPTLAE